MSSDPRGETSACFSKEDDLRWYLISCAVTEEKDGKVPMQCTRTVCLLKNENNGGVTMGGTMVDELQEFGAQRHALSLTSDV